MEGNEKLTIAVYNHHARSPKIAGGGRHYEVFSRLAEQGHDITILASCYDQGKRVHHYDEEVVTEEHGENFRYVYFKTMPAYQGTRGRFFNYRDYMKIASAYDGFSRKPDVVLASSVHPFAWTAGYRASKRYGARFILEVRDLWPLSMYEDFSGIMRKGVFAFFEAYERKYYGLAEKIITTAPYAHEYMEEKYGIDKNKVVHIPHGIDLEQFDRNRSQEEAALGEELKSTLENAFCVTYTGALSRSEGLETLVQAGKKLEKHRDLKIVIVGGGAEGPRLKELIEKEKITNVLMFDKVSRDTVPKILDRSKILFCGLRERKVFAYGISKNKFYDYMAASKPIVFASNVKGSLITRAEAGETIPPGDPGYLAAVIEKLYTDYDTLGKKYGEQGRRYVEENHTNGIIADKFLDVIRG